MNLRWIILAFFALLTVITSVSCKKSHEPEEGRATFSKEGLKYIQIPLNRYFIYKDSASGNLDSVVVTQSLLQQVHVPAYNSGIPFDFNSHPGYYYERFDITLSQFAGNTAVDWLKAKTAVYGNIYLRTNDDNAPITLQLIDSPYSSVFAYLPPTQPVSSITLEGKVYNDIIIFTNPNNGKPFVYYWGKNVGIIKRQVTIGSAMRTSTLLRHGN